MEIQKYPRIRFSSYSSSWDLKKLELVAIFNPYSDLPQTFEYVDLESVVGTKLINSRKESVHTAPSRAQRLASRGDVFYQAVRPYQKNNYLFDLPVGDYVFSTGYIQIRPSIDSYYLLSYVQKNDFVQMVLENCTGTSYPAINTTGLKKLEICFPNNLNEQAQIGQFFQNLDQSIALHEQKLTQTQNLKRAMLEKMFPKAGSKQPEIRLKGFSEDWAISQLSDFISIKHGFAFDGRYFSEMESNLCLITPGNFLIGGGFKTEKFVYYKGTVPNNYILSDDDLIVTMTDLSKDSDTLGCPALIPKKDGKIFLHNQRIGLISFEENGLNKGFLFYLLQTNFYHKYIVLSATGTTVKHTSPDKIKSFSCHIPEYEEQVKIGQFFEKIDGVMALHKQQLQTLKNLKQAFLIKMFV